MEPKWSKMTHRWLQDCTQMDQEDSRWAQTVPRQAQGDPKMFKRRAKMAQGDPKMAPRGPRWIQDGPKRPHDGSKRPQDGPKKRPRGLIRAQGGAQMKSKWRICDFEKTVIFVVFFNKNHVLWSVRGIILRSEVAHVGSFWPQGTPWWDMLAQVRPL